MNFPQNLRYTNEHEWIRVEGDIAYVIVADLLANRDALNLY